LIAHFDILLWVKAFSGSSGLNFRCQLILGSLELEELGKLAQHFIVDTVGVVLQNLQTSIGDLKDPPFWSEEQAGLLHVRPGPTHSIIEDKLAAAREQFTSFSVRQLKVSR